MASKPKSNFGKPEKKNVGKTIFLWVFIIAGIAGIVWMIAASPRQRNLNCSSNVPASLFYFGTCVEE